MKFDKTNYYKILSERRLNEEDMADMLRYDRAFIKPDCFNYVAIPRFKAKGGGTYPNAATLRRWESFGLFLVPINALDVPETIAGDWITFRREGEFDLRKVTFADVLKADDFTRI